jgi:hypothetical protein
METVRPGCGLKLPYDAAPSAPGLNASPECWRVYGEVIAYGAHHPAQLGPWHQTCVDAYAAQHVGPEMAALTGIRAERVVSRVAARSHRHPVRDAHGCLAIASVIGR